jgi:tetratricopeptide (TPR) repeat protein
MRTSFHGIVKQPLVYRLSFFLLFAGTLFADVSNFDEVRYPTLISAAYQKGKVLIDFEPVDEVGVTYRIYRSEQPVSSYTDISTESQITEISSDALPFQDEPESDGKYWYAVTVKTVKKEHTTIVPYQSATASPVDFSPFPRPIEELEIIKKSERSVQIRFTPLHSDYTYKIYVSREAFADAAGLEPVKIVEGDNAVTLEIEQDLPYFFLITTTNRLGVENTRIVSGKNTNESAFILKKKKPKPAPKGPTSKQRIEQTLQLSFYRGHYSEALRSFQSLLQEELSSSEQGSVHFYMGQCLFYLGEYEKAIKYFILSKETDTYRSSAGIWVKRCIERIE